MSLAVELTGFWYHNTLFAPSDFEVACAEYAQNDGGVLRAQFADGTRSLAGDGAAVAFRVECSYPTESGAVRVKEFRAGDIVEACFVWSDIREGGDVLLYWPDEAGVDLHAEPRVKVTARWADGEERVVADSV
jgi:hypothetical protein